MQCKICQKETKKIFKARILNKYTINYFIVLIVVFTDRRTILVR